MNKYIYEVNMINRQQYYQAIYETIRIGATTLPEDVKVGFEKAIEKEVYPAARIGLQKTYDSCLISARILNPACPDTGWPLFFIKLGNKCSLEGGVLGFEESSREAVARATSEGYLRATMKHPLTGYDPGNNLGSGSPVFTYQFVDGESIEITFVPKGGGSECFGGTRHRVIAFADGVKGIEKFVIDAFVEATRSGGICPPNILGIGIGGTANVAAELAKQAACLRTIGSKHPEPEFQKIENDLFCAINELEVGVMGIGGSTSVFAVNVEYAYTHIAGICVAISSNCMIARRASVRINSNGLVEQMTKPDWFKGR